MGDLLWFPSHENELAPGRTHTGDHGWGIFAHEHDLAQGRTHKGEPEVRDAAY